MATEGTVPMNVNKIVTHRAPHWDEAVAILMLRLFGEALFPGVRKAEVLFCDSGSSPIGGRTAEEWLANGCLLVGVGGGMFDEHPTATSERKRDCAATLVAKYLRVDSDPALKILLQYTYKMDSTSPSLPGEHRDIGAFTAANLGKLVCRMFGVRDDQALQWMTTAALAFYKEQKLFHSAREELRKGEFIDISDADERRGGNSLRIVAVESENIALNTAMRSTETVAVLVQKNPRTGHVQVFTDQSKWVYGIFDAVRLLRMAEVLKANPQAEFPPWSQLAREKCGNEVGDRWFFLRAGQMALNGSLTNKGATPTTLSLKEIAMIVRRGLRLARKHGRGCPGDERCACEVGDAIGVAGLKKSLGF